MIFPPASSLCGREFIHQHPKPQRHVMHVQGGVASGQNPKNKHLDICPVGRGVQLATGRSRCSRARGHCAMAAAFDISPRYAKRMHDMLLSPGEFLRISPMQKSKGIGWL